MEIGKFDHNTPINQQVKPKQTVCVWGLLQQELLLTATSGGGTPPATGVNGLEGLRMTPTATKGIYTGIGGDPTANRYGPMGNSINPTATFEVNSWNPSTTPGGSSGLRKLSTIVA